MDFILYYGFLRHNRVTVVNIITWLSFRSRVSCTTLWISINCGHMPQLTTDLQRAVADIGANRRLEDDTDRHLGIGGLGPELKVGIAK